MCGPSDTPLWQSYFWKQFLVGCEALILWQNTFLARAGAPLLHHDVILPLHAGFRVRFGVHFGLQLCVCVGSPREMQGQGKGLPCTDSRRLCFTCWIVGLRELINTAVDLAPWKKTFRPVSTWLWLVRTFVRLCAVEFMSRTLIILFFFFLLLLLRQAQQDSQITCFRL